MNEKLRNFLRSIKYTFKSAYSQSSFSQEGEDLILNRIFLNKSKGFYIDIGAHHPYRFSNTYFFYRKGWKGINIDPMPDSMKAFENKRNRDLNLEIGIGEKEEKLIYHIFDEPALNGFSEEQSIKFQNNTNCKLLRKIPVNVYPLSIILDKHCNLNQIIDFISIDAEGLDLQVLKSNNWKKYRPKIVLVEAHDAVLENIQTCPIYQFMHSKGYRLFGKSVLTYFYIESENENSDFAFNF